MARSIKKRGKSIFEVVKQTVNEFLEDDCPRMAAALAYYSIFSLPPLLFLIIMIAGFAFEAESAQQVLTSEIAAFVGTETAGQIGTMVAGASEQANSGGGLIVTILGGAAFLFGATSAFAQLQGALNRAWEVAPDPEKGGVWNFLLKRILSFGMILGAGFLLLVSLALSAAVSAIDTHAQDLLPGDIAIWIPRTLDFAISLSIITLLFAAIFKILPDARIRWREVWTGAIATAALFVISKFAIGFYLGRSSPGSAYGAAGSLAVLLLWMYLSAMILLIGAEFTQVWARRYGKRIEPSKGAVRMVWRTVGEALPDNEEEDSGSKDPA